MDWILIGFLTTLGVVAALVAVKLGAVALVALDEWGQDRTQERRWAAERRAFRLEQIESRWKSIDADNARMVRDARWALGAGARAEEDRRMRERMEVQRWAAQNPGKVRYFDMEKDEWVIRDARPN